MKQTLLSLTSVCLLVASCCSSSLCAQTFDDHTVLADKLTKPSRKHKSRGKTIQIKYENEDLIDIINYLAAQKGINIVLPMGNNTINSKITLNLPNPVSLDEAFDILYTILDIAGYSLIERGPMFSVVKNSKNVGREPMRLYINTSPHDLPDDDERIRFLYYLANAKIADDPNSDINRILKEFLPIDTSSYQLEPKTNAIIVTERSSIIKSVMQIITALDQPIYQEKLEIIKLRYTSADLMSKLFNDNILKSTDKSGIKAKPRASEAAYFADGVRIIPELRTNSLVILGREQASSRIKDFISKYIDVPIESGNSILHTYQLLYLDASTFADVLRNIVTADKGMGTGQSAAGRATGVDRFFEEVIVRADQPKGSKDTSYGGNKLIVACKNDDWLYIKKLIEQLDRPQPQVVIEVLIADLSINDLRQLGSSFRNPLEFGFPPGVNVQTAQVGPVILDSASNPTTIGGDLLSRSIKVGSGGPFSMVEQASGASASLAGGTAIAFQDKATGKTWGVTELLQTFGTSKILSHPYIIVTNNKPAFVTVGETRLVAGEATPSAAASTIKQEEIKADLTVAITPRISGANSIQLYIKIDISEFIPGAGNARTTRKIETRASVQSADILALGGLIKDTTATDVAETPPLSKIPIIGWLFKRRKASTSKTNLTVFISPTIIQPRLHKGVDAYTKDYIELANKYTVESQLFDGLRDPITRFFFRTGNDIAADSINAFVTQDEFKQDMVVKSPADEELERRKRNRKHPLLTKNDVVNELTPPEERAQHQEQKGSIPTSEKRTAVNLSTEKQTPEQVGAQVTEEAEHATEPATESHSVARKETASDKESLLKQLLKNEENPLVQARA